MADDVERETDRTLRLLWRRELGAREGSRGPKQSSSVDDVVRAAIAIADAEGLDALSMRKVGDRLGLRVMSVYTYVANRAELVSLMVDEVAGEEPMKPHRGATRTRLRRVCQQLYDGYRRHPWLLQAESIRGNLGPNVVTRYEWQLAAIEGIGLDDISMDQVITLIGGFAAGAAQMSIEVKRTQETSGLTDAEWWEINAPILDRVMAGTSFPLAGRVGTATGETYNAATDPDLSFRFGLDRILDGVEFYIAQRSGTDR
ncbi:TetR/AcrR family transcriptional regulator [Microlunatus speluncae]|uniref:TetR/AcrR family transcriptional regulator n=1 Tax=Microlunatus speluncae TaxID=2594267 RepID=UPI0012660FEE|nr:TetR/AcrR family transcriptional regulator C-terminal domain-containing protein [Microlunatus speluncae]